MTIVLVLAYFWILISAGAVFFRPWKNEMYYWLLPGFITGFFLAGLAFYALVMLHQLTGGSAAALVGGLILLGLPAWRPLARGLRETEPVLRQEWRTLDGRARIWIFLCLVGLTILFLCAYTPARDADAMRYHLAQLQETVFNKGFVFNPSYCHNFPQYFHYVLLPVFMLAGGTGFKLAVFLCFLISLFFIIRLARDLGSPSQWWWMAAGLIFTPLTILTSTVAGNDWAVICFGLAGIYVLLYKPFSNDFSNQLLAFISLGFAFGSKYQAALYFPIYWAIVLTTNQEGWPKRLFTAALLSCCAAACAAPFLIRNWHFLGNPVWPLMLDLFPAQDQTIHRMAQLMNMEQKGSYSIYEIAISVKNLMKDPMIPATLWFFFAGYWIAADSPKSWLKWGCAGYVVLWLVLQPRLYSRFAVYLLPFMLLMGAAFLESVLRRGKWLGKICVAAFLLTILAGGGVGALYAYDFLKFQLTRDEKELHRATSYYQDYQWVNKNIPEGKILAIVSHQQAFYLRQPHLLGDPHMSGLIAWDSFSSLDDMLEKLEAMGVRHIFYEDKGWAGWPGGEALMRLMKELKASKKAEVVYDKITTIYTRRLLNQHEERHVLLFLLNP